MSEKNKVNQTTTVVLRGEIDIYTVEQFRTLIEESINCGAAEIILDCTDLTYIDSIGMGVLIEMRNQTEEMGQKMTMKNPKENIKKLLTLTGVDRIINIV